MPSSPARYGLMAGLLALSIACFARQAAPQGDPPAAPPAKAGLPGFVVIPPGQVLPGCTDKEYVDRHRGNTDLKKVLIYDVWSTSIPPFLIPGFQMARYEVTNAQWKHYMDAEFRFEHTTAKGETLKSLAGQFVKFRGEPVESEWKAIYALNWRTLVDGWKKMKVRPKKAKAGENEGEKEAGKEGDPAGEAGKEAEEEEPAVPVWQPNWPVENPPSDPKNTIENLELPEGLKLLVYKTRVPQHWYGWCRLSGLGVGREYCDPSKPPAEAFMVPDEEPFKSLALADRDFSAYPARSISMNEGLAFAEWAGCQFATEYEWERAARGDNLRWPYSFGTWDHDKQKTIIAGAENERCRTGGPLRVDDESVSGGDSPFGARHMQGNVWEMTRTFYDVHPMVVPEPPRPDHIANYALVAKGGSFGDRWQLLMVCARTGTIGENGDLSLRDNNRADSLGMRLVRHDDRPGYDLMLHTIRRLSYDAAASDWSVYLPHSFAMERMAGTDDAKFVETGAPYVHAVKRTRGVAVAPLWATTLDAGARGSNKPERNKYYVLGAFRSDVALRAGVRLTEAEMRKKLEDREKYKKLVEAYKKLPPAKQKNVQMPDPPAPPDEYEKLTEKNKDELGLWEEKDVAPGEWFVVYWNGFVGLVNKNLTTPPDAILMIDPKQLSRRNEQPQPSEVTLDAAKQEIRFQFDVWEQPSDKAKQVVPPGPEHSERWALCEAVPSFFIKGAASARPYCWHIDVAFKVAAGDNPGWKALAPGATTKPPETKPPGNAEPEDKKTTEKK